MEHKELREAVVAEARTWLGTPFQHQGRVKGPGIDCIGLIYMLAKKYELGETSMAVLKKSGFTGYAKVPKRGQMRSMCTEYLKQIRYEERLAGDVFLIRIGRLEGHVGLYTGDNTVIHAMSTFNKCVEHSINSDFRLNITGTYRFPRLCN